MRNRGVIIATNAEFLFGVLREKLRDAGLQAFIAATDDELAARIKATASHFIFIEDCFHGYGTDAFIQRMVKRYRTIHIAVWAAAMVQPPAAARFIMAGAESFFSLRDTESTIETILWRIAGGQQYCPADVKAVLEKSDTLPAIGEELTPREIEIVKLTGEGKTNRQIGDMLSMSVHTVKFHRANIYRKCGGNTPVDIVRNGLMRGLIRPEDLR